MTISINCLSKLVNLSHEKALFCNHASLAETSLISGAEIDALSLKFELAEYGEKALQAMGARRY